MRRKLVAGNWKMNKDIHETGVLIEDLKTRMRDFKEEVGVAIFPPYASLVVAQSLTKDTPIKLGAQNMSQHDDGAYTGEISARMLKTAGCSYVILGHSERRQYYGEDDELVNKKIKKALETGLTPVVCVGETLEEREKGITDLIVTTQVKGVLHELASHEIEKLVIAYEPVWAIGTGKTATPAQANEAHLLIRKLIGRIYSWAIAEKTIILYGGSVNAQNALSLFSQADIDGGLIGGASLKADSFMSIIQAAQEACK